MSLMEVAVPDFLGTEAGLLAHWGGVSACHTERCNAGTERSSGSPRYSWWLRKRKPGVPENTITDKQDRYLSLQSTGKRMTRLYPKS
jgi:hypothetical protein